MAATPGHGKRLPALPAGPAFAAMPWSPAAVATASRDDGDGAGPDRPAGAPPGPSGAEGPSPREPTRPSLRDRWRHWRDARLTDPAFRRAAARWWPTRWLARRRAAALFDLVAGFVYSQVLLAAVRLRLFDRLAAGPLDTPVLAARIGLPAPAALRLLEAAAALGLVERRGRDRWGIGPLGAPMVGNEALQAMVEHHGQLLYPDLRDPVALLRGDGPGSALNRYWAYATADEPSRLARSDVDAYSALMSASQPLVADEVLDAVSLRGVRCLMDVGGGQGRFLQAVAARHPRLRLVLFDLPAVVEGARERLAAAGLAGRIEGVGGDFTAAALPRSADAVSLVRVLYDHGDDRAAAVLRAAYEALPSGGLLIVAEPMAAAPGAPRLGPAYFGMYLLAMGSGHSRSAQALAALVRAAGFRQVRVRPTPLPLHVGVLTARKP